jgi:ATP/ADP translocase
MKNTDHKFRPYKPKISIILAVILLIVLILITAILRSTIGWPPDSSTNTILIGILLLSLFEVLFFSLEGRKHSFND